MFFLLLQDLIKFNKDFINMQSTRENFRMKQIKIIRYNQPRKKEIYAINGLIDKCVDTLISSGALVLSPNVF